MVEITTEDLKWKSRSWSYSRKSISSTEAWPKADQSQWIILPNMALAIQKSAALFFTTC